VTVDVDALLFDAFGTVVDWRTSVIERVQALVRRPEVDWAGFVDEWRRDGYLAPISRIVAGAEPWVPVDELHRRSLGVLLPKYGLALPESMIDRLVLTWHRLRPWPDAVEGLRLLKRAHVVSPLSNGGFALLTTMAKFGGLPWDCVISTELFGTYKPAPASYLGAAALLDLPVDRVMMVAAHPNDLLAAAAVGMRTAFVPRPAEWGPDATAPEPDPSFDVVAADFVDLSARVG
jgi:2-haloacid dehalogenase